MSKASIARSGLSISGSRPSARCSEPIALAGSCMSDSASGCQLSFLSPR